MNSLHLSPLSGHPPGVPSGAVPRQLHGREADLTAFFRLVQPGDGWRCLFLLNERKHVWFESSDVLVPAVLSLGDRPDIYFSVGTFHTQSRTQAQAAQLKAFIADIDCGAEKFTRNPEGAYPTQSDGVSALVNFAKDTKLKPSMIVSSGEGLHVYWVLDEPIPAADWTAQARDLKRLFEHKGLKADPSRTADAASVLRPLGTAHKNGKRVALLKDTGVRYG